MDWEKFVLHARKNGLMFSAGGQYEFRRGDVLLVPFRTPKDPRNVYELVKLVGAYAHPAKRAVSVKQLADRVTKRADIANPDVPTITWHHPWRLPTDLNVDECVTLSEYLTTNGYATS